MPVTDANITISFSMNTGLASSLKLGKLKHFNLTEYELSFITVNSKRVTNMYPRA